MSRHRPHHRGWWPPTWTARSCPPTAASARRTARRCRPRRRRGPTSCSSPADPSAGWTSSRTCRVRTRRSSPATGPCSTTWGRPGARSDLPCIPRPRSTPSTASGPSSRTSSFAFESGTRFGYEPSYTTWAPDDGTDPAIFTGSVEEISRGEDFVKLLVQSKSVLADELLERVRTALARRPDRDALVHPGLRPGRGERPRGEQGRHAGPGLRAPRDRSAMTLPPSATCRMMSTC